MPPDHEWQMGNGQLKQEWARAILCQFSKNKRQMNTFINAFLSSLCGHFNMFEQFFNTSSVENLFKVIKVYLSVIWNFFKNVLRYVDLLLF